MTTYSIVSAVYNVSEYLEDYFESIFSQTISQEAFKLIMVDDGSTDNSREIINQWQQKYPDHIQYVYQENAGQAAARNKGLHYVDTPWVTFIDPDDFIKNDYFEIVDREITAHDDLQMVCCKCVYFYEGKEEYSDTHPLRDFYPEEGKLYSVNDDHMALHLRVNNAFFRTEVIVNNSLTMPEDMRPSFEGVYYANRYILALEQGTILFTGSAEYYYRKRSAKTSSLDGGWTKPGKITTVPKNGWLGLLNEARSIKGYVPNFIQRVVLFNYCWYIQRFCWRPNRWSMFTDEQMTCFYECLDEVFKNIEYETLIEFPENFINRNSKYFLAKHYYGKSFDKVTVYIKYFNLEDQVLRISCVDEGLKVFVDGNRLVPSETKLVTSQMLDRAFYSLKYSQYKLPTKWTKLKFVSSEGAEIAIFLDGRRKTDTVTYAGLKTRWDKKLAKYPHPKDVWVVMDRDTQADDNGEHFYRWLRKHHPFQKAFFALRKSSKDWDRLAREGFKLVDFGSKEHEELLKTCSTIISAHADAYVHSYFGDNFLNSKKYVFLQHGVIHNDVHTWLNPKPISLMIATTNQERKFMVEDGSQFKLMPNQVTLTGLARHDSLVEKNKKQEKKGASRKTILIMPTWRNSLVGARVDGGNDRALSDAFAESEFLNKWKGFLESQELKNIADENNARIVFFPHANVIPYVLAGVFSVPDYIEVHSNNTGNSIQDDFVAASILITDYSSVAFDVALLNKPCLYYQFDKEEFFSEGHIFSRGYFDYERDGFGPVVTSKDELVSQLSSYAQSGFVNPQKYSDRVNNTFPFRDGGCCKRIYKEIKRLGK